MDKKIEIIADRIVNAKKFIVFTGAGISTESGIPDYRSQGGIWDRYRPVYFDEFMTSREHRIKYWKEKMDFNQELEKAGPNKGHLAIAKLNEMGFVHTLITQNIDGLHQESGIPDDRIIELHGNTRRIRCMTCSATIPFEQAKKMIEAGDPAPECECGGFLKPDTISFGQSMPVQATRRAAELSSGCDLFMVVGSTLVVQPASLMPEYAKQGGAFLVIINLSETPCDKICDVLIQEKAGKILEEIVSSVEKNKNRPVS
ncbi:MAG: Sir2 family NAD-dependent protein deacetylase [Thermodesulfobacteriota bacterium]|nr:Sir2 family NAD-dependent protein deacetylase [Thermodesulfobacteriota bacterium]